MSFVATSELAKLASQDVRMVLTGDGADELFAGYSKYSPLESSDASHIDTNPLSDSLFLSYLDSLQYISLEQRRMLYSSSSSNQIFARSISDIMSPYISDIDSSSALDTALLLDLKTLLPGNNLVKPDRMGMAHSVEARSPFLDHRMVSLALSMPSSFKLKKGIGKFIVKQAMAPFIGSNIAFRKKQMFTVPVGSWLKQDPALLKELVLSEPVLDLGLFNFEYLRDIVESHVNGTSNNTSQLRLLLSFSHWLNNKN